MATLWDQHIIFSIKPKNFMHFLLLLKQFDVIKFIDIMDSIDFFKKSPFKNNLYKKN